MKKKLTIGEFTKLFLQYQHTKSSDRLEKFKQFIENCADISDLTSRQIDRIMRLEDFPNKTAIDNLSLAVPDMSIFNPRTVSHRLLLEFSSVSRIQSEFHKKYGNLKITIVAGWTMPQALIDEQIALTLAENIYSGISYEFIYPSIYDHPQLLEGETVSSEEANSFLRKKLRELIDIVENKIMGLDKSSEDKIKKMEKAMQKTRDNIVFVSTYSEKSQQSKLQPKSVKKKEKCEDETVLFWLLMPSEYVVFYNLGKVDEKDVFSKGGSLMVTGKVIIDNDFEPDFESKGWLHMSSRKYQEIENEYNKFRESWEEIAINNQ
jgi:hypothetical protein